MNTLPLRVLSLCKTAGWMKMPLGTELGLGSGDIVLDGDPAPLPKKGADQTPIFDPCIAG